MEHTVSPQEIEPSRNCKLVTKTQKSTSEKLESISSSTSTQDDHEEERDGNFDLPNTTDLPLCTLPEFNIVPCVNLKELIINYIKNVPTLTWLPISVSILSLAVTPDNSIPSHILLPRATITNSSKMSPNLINNATKSNINSIKFRGKAAKRAVSVILNKKTYSRKRCRTHTRTMFKPISLNPRLSESSTINNIKGKLPKLLVVLDMDETLIHMHTNPHVHYDYTINLLEHSKSEDPMFISCNIHPTMYISLRPGVKEFLRYLSVNSDFYEVALFTAGTQLYADAVLEGLDPNCTIIPSQNRYYRESCDLATINPYSLMDVSLLGTTIENVGQVISFLQKDLSKLGWPLTRTLLLDNSLLSFSLHPDNGVWIKSYFPEKSQHEDRRDESENRECLFKFSEVIELLEVLKDVADVRPHLRNHFNLTRLLGKSFDTNDHHNDNKSLTAVDKIGVNNIGLSMDK
ncbi:NLI interacting factor-like phosphatase [Babesia microti strain RI]|uniref:Mitochondrial import inner membrane translocase subunit TIM50 n=1 Tax=Babesia microti (strain RI) TaxID=1133968 RepID=I7IHG7_BABMR|nr:NLI interacting factor-like phosphatase [Babesia microti strain RI]CCF75782.1 NLI interacting factor-like phosphatase [Babesia microti strain RI]|eukprot:XP_012650190.1 NLI interacting factor-like phosphatase [Babesia microti strain RI]